MQNIKRIGEKANSYFFRLKIDKQNPTMCHRCGSQLIKWKTVATRITEVCKI